LKLVDEAVRVAVGLHLGLNLCIGISGTAEHWLTPAACTVLSVSRHRAKLFDTTLLTTWLPEHSPQLAFQCPKSQPVSVARTENVQIA